jgi:hypothetical protein
MRQESKAVGAARRVGQGRARLRLLSLTHKLVQPKMEFFSLLSWDG